MTPLSNKVSNLSVCDVPISLADNSTATASRKGKRSVTWPNNDGTANVGLSNTLVSKKLNCSLLSIPALVEKGIAAVFIPGKALLVDLQNEFKIIGVGIQRINGLFYISDDGSIDKSPYEMKTNQQTDRALMAIVKDNLNVRSQDQVMSSANKTQPCTTDPAKIWHLRFGHAMSIKTIRQRLASNTLPKPDCFRSDCTICTRAKQRREFKGTLTSDCLLYTSPSPRDQRGSRMPSSA